MTGKNTHRKASNIRRLESLADSPYADEGVEIVSIHNHHEHYKVRVHGILFDFWPSTGKWHEVNGADRGARETGITGMLDSAKARRSANATG